MPDRILRAGIIASDPVNRLSWPAEVFYRRLFSVADDFGRYDARPAILKSYLYPLKSDRVAESDIGKWLTECVNADLVRVYTVDSKRFLEILKFDQRIRPGSKSKWPEPSGGKQLAASCGESPQVPALFGIGGVVVCDKGITQTPRGIEMPTLEQVLAECGMRGYQEADGRAFWNHFEAVGWLNKHNQPISNWKSKLNNWITDARGREQEKKRRGNDGKGQKPDHGGDPKKF